MRIHFFTAPFLLLSFGSRFRVQGSRFKVQGSGVKWRLRRNINGGDAGAV